MRWKMRNGTEIEISDMKTTHIINSLRMIKNQGYVSPKTVSFYIGCPRPNGEAANDAFDNEFNDVMDSPVTPYIDEFEDELKKRGMSEEDIRTALRDKHIRVMEPTTEKKDGSVINYVKNINRNI